MKKGFLVPVGLAVVLLILLGLCSGCREQPSPTTEPTVVPTVSAPELTATDTPAPPTDTPSATEEPTTTPEVITMPERVMYVCGYDRCEDSAEYGLLLFETGITVWEKPDPDRGDRLRQVNNRDAAVVVGEMRVAEGPGGLWYELKDGGWISNLWLTEAKCSIYNLPGLSFESCLGAEAATEPTAAPTPSAATVTLAPTATRIPTFTLAPTTEVATPTRLPTATPSLTFTPPPTETASPTPVPTPTDTQAPTATPVPTESGVIEVTAWVSDASPSQDSDVTVYGKITRGGRGVSGVSMHTTWRYQTTWSYCDGTSGADGQASCTRDIGPATEGYRVVVTVRFTYEDRDYRAHTEFTPR